MHPKVSIVVPAYNEEKYLERTLQSVKKQTYTDYELIVVDNNSTDRTAEIASKFTDNVIKQLKPGLTPTRNRGFDKAKGDIIVKLDSDTILDKNTLAEVVGAFDNNRVSALTVMQIFSDKSLFFKLFSLVYLPFVLAIERLMMGHNGVAGPLYAIRSSVWKKIHPHDDDKHIHEDMDMSCHAANHGKVIILWRTKVYISARRFREEPLHTIRYIKKGFYTYILHHPNHKLHKVN